jgi:small nuclear ribonucleoprotein (snRNP)-like protein
MEPLNILLNYFDTEVNLYLKDGKKLVGKFIKFNRVSETMVNWIFLEKKNYLFFRSDEDLHLTQILSHSQIRAVEKAVC